MQFLLASQSPRRRELVQLLGYPVAVEAADVDEDSVTDEDPAVNVVETAVLKAITIAQRLPTGADSLIIAADTTVALGQTMLNKPADVAEATAMLVALRNRTHHVHTGIVVWDGRSGQMVKRVNTAVVTMRDYSDAEIAAYVTSGDPLDKAGAYAIQHPTFRPVAALAGCYLAVVGLSICELIGMLLALGVPCRADVTAVHAAHHHFPCPVFDQLFVNSPNPC